MTSNEIIEKLPYQTPFLFVDEISSISEDGISGYYTLKKDEYFYEGHFKGNPITPGVILTEIMAQIGVVCLGIFLIRHDLKKTKETQIALTSSQIDFFLPVFPKERVKVISEKEFFRFNKLKCKVKMLNEQGEMVCRGIISGMIKST
ncbi:MAG: FabA/FabZ family ACP-dehydratase [Gelidibacter sp.]